ncbi:MAG TPA: transposase [Armatimonadota bacterium]|jgi:REP element-mobilizing transposase RayT
MNNPVSPHRHNRRPRLDPSVYGASGYAVHVILGSYRRRPIFRRDAPVSRLVVNTLTDMAAESAVKLYVYCLMPDHLHFISAVQSGGRDLQRFIQVFRRRLTYATRDDFPPSLWQRSFYDHVLRDADHLGELCAYVVNNPMRKGLVERWEDYPLTWLSDEV